MNRTTLASIAIAIASIFYALGIQGNAQSPLVPAEPLLGRTVERYKMVAPDPLSLFLLDSATGRVWLRVTATWTEVSPDWAIPKP